MGVCCNVGPGFHDEDYAKINEAAAVNGLLRRSFPSQTRATNNVLEKNVRISNHVKCKEQRAESKAAGFFKVRLYLLRRSVMSLKRLAVLSLALRSGLRTDARLHLVVCMPDIL
jgi:hypothetical protein